METNKMMNLVFRNGASFHTGAKLGAKTRITPRGALRLDNEFDGLR